LELLDWYSLQIHPLVDPWHKAVDQLELHILDVALVLVVLFVGLLDLYSVHIHTLVDLWHKAVDQLELQILDVAPVPVALEETFQHLERAENAPFRQHISIF
jgi:hypothetical protein